MHLAAMVTAVLAVAALLCWSGLELRARRAGQRAVDLAGAVTFALLAVASAVQLAVLFADAPAEERDPLRQLGGLVVGLGLPLGVILARLAMLVRRQRAVETH